MRVERIEERVEAEIRQELPLRGVAGGGQSVPLTQAREGREVDVAGDVLLPDVPVRVVPGDVLPVADQRALVVPGGVQVAGFSTVVDRQNESAIQSAGDLVSPILQREVHLSPIAFR